MNGWALFWTICFGASLTLFSILAVVVGVGGWRDLKIMISRLGGHDPDAD